MSEDFDFSNLELDLGEEAHARVDHAEFLEKVKDWGRMLGLITVPFASMGQAIIDLKNALESDNEDERKWARSQESDVYQRVAENVPQGTSVLIDHINEFYVLLQTEAVKILGAPFAMHKEHNEDCDGTLATCPHQDHFTEGNA